MTTIIYSNKDDILDNMEYTQALSLRSIRDLKFISDCVMNEDDHVYVLGIPLQLVKPLYEILLDEQESRDINHPLSVEWA